MRRRGEGVDPKLWAAARSVSRRLTLEHIPHALIGGLAVSHYGYPRATRDVDLLVSPEAMATLTGRPTTIGFTDLEGDVEIDYMITDEWEPFLESAIEAAKIGSEQVPVIPLGALVYLKLASPRRKDRQDVIELIRGGIRVAEVKKYLEREIVEDPDSDILAEFELCVREADEP